MQVSILLITGAIIPSSQPAFFRVDPTSSRRDSRFSCKPVSTFHWVREKCGPVRPVKLNFTLKWISVSSGLISPFQISYICLILNSRFKSLSTPFSPGRFGFRSAVGPQVSAALCFLCLLWNPPPLCLPMTGPESGLLPKSPAGTCSSFHIPDWWKEALHSLSLCLCEGTPLSLLISQGCHL